MPFQQYTSNFLQLISDHLPDMLWVKNTKGEYLFANKAICDNLLMAKDTEEPIGKTDIFFALREREKHPENPSWHTFGELCLNTDQEVLRQMKPMQFEEYGNIRGELVYLDVHKAPFYDNNGVLVGVIGSGRNITRQKYAEEQALYSTNHDRLTGLPNRQKMIEDMNSTPPVGCAIFNIDSFREINDFFGVANGDNLLIQLAEEAKKRWTPTYRIGGDEFAILFHKQISESTLKELIETILSDIDAITFSISGEKVKVRFRVGIALGTEKVLTRADIALHRAKDKKIPYALYESDENIEDQYQKNIQMAGSIHRALSENRIVCVYQPIVQCNTLETHKYETLVRMIDDEGRVVPPLEFLPIAKKTQLYSKITQSVIHQSCKAFQNRTETFSINLSIDDIENPYTVQEIITTIIKTNTANRIIFEILESEGIENYESVIRFATQVRALGAKIAIDDFGTGYSNFEHILRLNVDCIKIDGSLIQGIINNKRHQIIVETIVQFAHKMGAETIAEYVSDEEIFNSIKKMGIEYSQGYFTGKPANL